MGSYTFRWEHPAQEVFVTGTFDNWGKTQRLERNAAGVFEKTVELPKSEGKIMYKFVADGNWNYNHTAKTETDHEGNVNNVLYPQDLTPSAHSAAIASVAPGATTAAMAGAVPLEGRSPPPGAFPESPATEVPPTATTTTTTTASSAQGAEQTFSVNPIPATGGIGNPVSLAPGEKVPDPSTLTGHTADSNVRYDEASYNRPDAGVPVLPPVLTPGSEAEAAGQKAVFGGLGPAAGTMIPESSMPMGAAAGSEAVPTEHISSVGPRSTTAALAGQQPIINHRAHAAPEIVQESQQAAHVDPEAAANPAAVEEKTAMESELASKVPEAPAADATGAAGSSTVPEVVQQSEQAAHVGPEAAANPEAVQEKAAVESELAQKVPEARATSSNGALGSSEKTQHIAEAAAAYAARNAVKEHTGTDPASVLPKSVQDSINNMNNKGSTVQASPEVVHAALASKGTTAPQDVQDSLANKGTTAPPAAVQESLANKGTTAPPAAVQESLASKGTTAPALDAQLPQQVAAGEPVSVPAATEEAGGVPKEVLASEQEAGVDPEAAANPEAVAEKSAVEQELLKKVPESEAQGEPAPTAGTSAALTETGPGTTSASGAPQLGDPTSGVAALSMDDKPSTTTGGLNAPASDPAVPAVQAAQTENALPVPAKDTERSRDVSPMTRGPNDQPTVTTGVGSATTPARTDPTAAAAAKTAATNTASPQPRTAPSNSTPQKRGSFVDRFKGTPDSTRTQSSTASGEAADGKKKKGGFFKRLAEKLK